MVVVKSDSLQSSLRGGAPRIAVFYGFDEAEIGAKADQFARSLGEASKAAYDTVKFDWANIASDPAIVIDEVQGISLFGGSRLIWLRDVDDRFVEACKAILGCEPRGNPVLATAGNLSKSSKLRQLLEGDSGGWIIPVYEAEPGRLMARIRSALAQDNLTIDEAAGSMLIAHVDGASGLLEREIEKLRLFCVGRTRVTADDVRAISGESVSGDLDEFVDHVFMGETARAQNLFGQLSDSGVDAGRMIMALHGHALRLFELRNISEEKGFSAAQAVRAARPPIFFKRTAVIEEQLRRWPVERLEPAASRIGAAIREMRLTPLLTDALAGSLILSLGRAAS